MDSEERSETMRQLGAEGGKARAAALTSEEKSEIAKKAADARWSIPRATHEGDLKIGGIEIACANLDSGLRVLTQSGFMIALGRARQAKGRQHYDGDVNMPAFLTAKNLKPFIPEDLAVTSSQIEFRTLKGTKAFGYSAELLPKVCYVFLDAKEAGELDKRQDHIALRAKILARGLAHVGIIALVDEATGYQDVRDRLALQEILDRYLRKEFAVWAKKFSDDFYKEIFRLRGWKWRGMKINRPQCVAKYTMDIVYSRLAPGMVKELEKRNPMLENGRRKAHHHRLLTEDIGDPALAQHVYGVTGLMRTCDDGDWSGFIKLLNRAYPKKENLPLFKDLDD